MPQGFTVWFTGMSGSGKTTAASLLERQLRAAGANVEVLDGDVLRTRLCKGLGFSKADRDENVRRIGFVCELLSRNGVTAVAATISPYRAVRDEIRARIPNFVEVYMECPLEVLVARDVKGCTRRRWRERSSNSRACRIPTSCRPHQTCSFIPTGRRPRRASGESGRRSRI